MNVIKDLKRVDHKKFLNNKPDLPPHRDFNDKWDDDDDWPKKDQPTSRRGRIRRLPLSRYCPPVTPLSGVTAIFDHFNHHHHGGLPLSASSK